MLKNSSNVYDAGWLDIVFNKRNKVYGAYALRLHSGSTLTKAFFIAAPVFIMLFVGPYIYQRLNPDVYATDADFTPIKDLDLPIVPQQKKQEVKQEQLKVEKVKMKQFISNIQVVKTPLTTEVPTLDELQDVAIGPLNQDGPATPGNAAPEPVNNGGTGTMPPVVDDSEHTIATIDSYPEFEGGMKAWVKYMEKNLKYPYGAQDAEVQGKVYVSFVVEKDGSITDVTVLKGIGFGCDEEAVRVIKKSPKWRAGMQHDATVRVRYNMPITFSLR